ncbi:XRE family transcriptional regulator [Caenispirillum bisanense]|uniref:Zn-dependent peptidase ImmA, M78 family n=1 Tax=Caenispirillum bisanense TaxID=414052 RepID=A0A286GKE5_9PROT|nr:XRE family transcriptional regulator [Caenispirillum bisanense]SOD96008.1 Zn-dependent peptidase ImmA, M78 family [Caenispirillum bisanense]
MAEALVTPEVLTWARERAGLSTAALAERLGVEEGRVIAWETAAERPTFGQAEQLARTTHVPFGAFFLPSPPDDDLPLPDLRAGGAHRSPALDAAFKDALGDVFYKFDWYREYRRQEGADPLPFVGRYSTRTEAAVVAEDMARVLGLTPEVRAASRGAEEFLRRLIGLAEGAGIWVLRNGVVGGNTHRPLDVGVFRGFAIADPVLPTIFLNGRDAYAGQIFTLAHELAHLWIGQSGISDPLAVPSGRAGAARVEACCNRVAADLLAPRQDVQALWVADLSLDRNAEILARHFRVSAMVIGIRARDMGLVDRDTFERFRDAELQRWRRLRESAEGGGGDYYVTARSRNGGRFMRAVVAQAMSGHLLLRDAASLLNMTPKTLRVAHARMGEGRL